MADSNFQYTQQFLLSIERTLPRERLRPYLAATQDDTINALELYELNVALSEAMYGYLHGFEIALRNAVHQEMARFYKTSEWYEAAPLSDYGKRKIREAKEAIARSRQSATAGKVVAELGLSFWVSLVATRYDETLWRFGIYRVFPSARRPRSHIHRRLETIANLRNRIAHHERVLTSQRTLRAGHQRYVSLREISECAAWICPDTAQWLGAKFRYTEAGSILLKVSTMGVNLA